MKDILFNLPAYFCFFSRKICIATTNATKIRVVNREKIIGNWSFVTKQHSVLVLKITEGYCDSYDDDYNHSRAALW